jgi:hypothetical protein
MRKLISSVVLFIGYHVAAQNYCHTTEKQNEWFSKHPELKANFEKYQEEAANIDKELYKTGYNVSNSAGRTASVANYTIPMVFHILHTGVGENISDAQVQDAVSILTRDYNSENADTSNVVVQFKNLIGNTKFAFALATKDPNGNCTNGIIRHFDANTDWSGDLSNYAYTWPPTRYLNVYVVRSMGGGAAGYTYLPGSGIPSSMDAVVILNSYVGSIGSGNVFTSRALTHEVGHWFNLAHVWGGTNQPGVACGDDGVSDTPITKGYTMCNLGNSAICNPGIVENVQNYMEYAHCQRMFTKGQSARMITSINSPINGRNNVSTSNNLSITGVTNPGTNCVPALDITATPSYTICSGKSLSLSSFTYNAAPTSYSWSADNYATIANPTAAATSITFNNNGITVVSCMASNAGGSSSNSISITVEDGITEITGSNSESFEGSSIAPPSLWKVINPSSSAVEWQVTGGAASSGVQSMLVPGENLSANSVEILESPSYDFKNNPGAVFTFKYAYAMKSAANKDLFKVQASSDCGGTWTDVWVPLNTSLQQNSGGIRSALYTSPASSEWKLCDLTSRPNFFPFKTEDNVLIRFYFEEDVNGVGFGNRFYLDEVDFSTPTGINEITKSASFNLYPNPTNASFNLNFNLADASKIKYQVTSVTGAVMIEESEKTYSEGAHEININQNAKLAGGIYFINLELNGIKMSKKLIIE